MNSLFLATIFDSQTNYIKASQEDRHLLEDFPYQNYKIYHVPFMGSFWLDDIRDLVKDELKNQRVWEPLTQTLIAQYTIPGSIGIDIGAHIGIHTLTLSRYAEHVYAFEPQKKLYGELVMNLQLNKCSNVTAYRVALGDKSSIICMDKPTDCNEGATGIGKGGDFAPMIRLDDLQLSNVSLIKIDVENTEKEVLLGSSNTLKQNRPILLLEMCGRADLIEQDRRDHVLDTMDLLLEMGYVTFPFAHIDYMAVSIERAHHHMGWNL